MTTNIDNSVTYVTFEFNDNVNIKVSTASCIYKNSLFLQSFDVYDNIPFLCPSTYILDKKDEYYDHQQYCFFNNNNDLLFMFMLQPTKFLEVCKFLDIIEYNNEDNKFSKQFIIYVMKKVRTDIQIIQYFMQNEIISILNCINNIDINIQMQVCTPIFYFLYLTEYKEEVIKHKRIDILYEVLNKNKQYQPVDKNFQKLGKMLPVINLYYRHIYKYDNTLTYIITQTNEYINFILKLQYSLIFSCTHEHDGDELIKIINSYCRQGANINFQDKYGNTILHLVSTKCNNNLNIFKYLVENGANINLQNNDGNTALHLVSIKLNNLEIFKYLVKNGADINLKNNNGISPCEIRITK